MARYVERYNKVIKLLNLRGLKAATSIEDLERVLKKDVQFHRTRVPVASATGSLKEADKVDEIAKQWWLQVKPDSPYGARVVHHELLHLAAAIKGQKDTYVHEVVVALVTTPETGYATLVVSAAALGMVVYSLIELGQAILE